MSDEELRMVESAWRLPPPVGNAARVQVATSAGDGAYAIAGSIGGVADGTRWQHQGVEEVVGDGEGTDG